MSESTESTKESKTKQQIIGFLLVVGIGIYILASDGNNTKSEKRDPLSHLNSVSKKLMCEDYHKFTSNPLQYMTKDDTDAYSSAEMGRMAKYYRVTRQDIVDYCAKN